MAAKTPQKNGAAETIAIIGSGFGGIGLAWHLKQAGIEDFTLFEKASELGGTWRENTYPGCGCDVASHLYSYSFEPHYPWRFRYGKQAEILEYLNHVADKYDLRKHIRFNSEVEGAKFDAKRGLWSAQLKGGETHASRFLTTAVGQLSRPQYANVPGIDRFKGKSFHSAEWDHDYDLNGKHVAVIGTGASAVQFVPEIVKQVRKLHLFQRTPGWTIPKVDREFKPTERKLLDKAPLIHDLDRQRIFAITESVGYAYQGHEWALKAVTALAKSHLHRQISDPTLRKKLTPDYPVGCKRILLSNDWYPAISQLNVELVTDHIDEITETGVVTKDGYERKVDTIIHGTGFAATELLAPMEITGLRGKKLSTAWKNGAEAYMGMSTHGFPNLFMLYGPNTNLGSGSIIYMLECQQRYIVQMLQTQQSQGWKYAHASAEAQQAFVDEIQQRTEQSTYAGDCQSWYKTADGRNTNTWVGSQREFKKRSAEIQLKDYELV